MGGGWDLGWGWQRGSDMGTGRRDSFRETQASVGPSGCEKSGGRQGEVWCRGRVRGKAGPGDRWASLVQSGETEAEGVGEKALSRGVRSKPGPHPGEPPYLSIRQSKLNED